MKLKNQRERVSRRALPSNKLKQSIETLPHRALLRAGGLKDADFKKPFIGIANSYNSIIPGHIHLNELTEYVKKGIRDAGGVPFVWGVPGVCDGIAMYVEMRLSLPSRDHIADNIEIMALSHSLDGWVGVTNCDKITPGMLMAAGRLDLPTMILTGGPMKSYISHGKKIHPIQGFGLVGQVNAGKMSFKDAEAQMKLCENCHGGSCVGLYTANTMACVTEVLGMSVVNCAATPAVSKEKRKQAYETGRKIVELVKKGIKPSRIMTCAAFENAIKVDMAMGGSTNTVLHIPAIAKELGINIDSNTFDKISRKIPNICHIIPAGPYEMYDLYKAGGIPAVISRLAKYLKGRIKKVKVLNDEIIRPLNNPYFKEGGIAVLKGNIAKSSVIKQTAVDASMMVHSGQAKVFSSEEAVLKAIENKKIKESDVVVLNFLGPAGAPGMPEMLTPTDAIKGAGYKKVALITDGRFSGGTSGPCIAHVEPEAYNGGVIGIIKNGDIIDIDIPKRKLNIRLSKQEINKRFKKIKAPKRKLTPLLVKFRNNYAWRRRIY